MKKVFIKISALSIALVVAASCSKTGTTGPAGATGPAGPSLTGNTQGVVSLYDVGGSKQLSATLQAGDSLIITNSSTNAVMKTVTSSTGAFAFNNLNTGTYNITVSKPGYGKVMSQGVQILGGGSTDRNFALSVIPTTTITAAVANDTTYIGGGAGTPTVAVNYVKTRGYVPVSTSETTVMVFVSMPGVSSTNSTVGNWSANYTATVAPGSTKFSISIPTSSLYDLGFVSGNTVYFAAYIIGGNTGASSYVDWTTGQTVYTALSSTPINLSAPVQ
ncbi:MAG TPA: carboxypeptidase-like regulatory domain-containing protein [Bacteroidia bacterium]|nr:carboxypeptidase-like regulatory domain-containing protein [Bacteroidia bacterium]